MRQPAKHAMLVICVLLCGFIPAAGHSDSPTEPAAAQQQDTAAATDPPPPRSLFPNLREKALLHDGRRFWIRPILAILADYTFFHQDNASLAQVGEQQDTRDLRAARIGLTMRSKGKLNWEGLVIFDYQEARTREDNVFQLYDLRLRLPLGKGRIDIGKQKQPWAYEVVGLSLIAPFQERILSPFFVTRSIGVQFSGPLAGDRMTWSAGWYNDWLESDYSFGDNANDFVGRITGLASVSPDNHNYLHLGFGVRQTGDDAGYIRMRGRPESNVADYYVDTGAFRADAADQLSLELAWSRGPLQLQAEHIETWVQSPENGDPHFNGSYLGVSWMVTGESRPYFRSVGFAGQAIPTRATGAIELVTRYSRIDLDDRAIHGGRLQKWHFGINWWASQQWKIGLSWGDADLDRDGINGNTKMLLSRLQWFY